MLDHVADKWTALIMTILADGTIGYADIRRSAAGVSDKMLAQTLHKLERGYHRWRRCGTGPTDMEQNWPLLRRPRIWNTENLLVSGSMGNSSTTYSNRTCGDNRPKRVPTAPLFGLELPLRDNGKGWPGQSPTCATGEILFARWCGAHWGRSRSTAYKLRTTVVTSEMWHTGNSSMEEMRVTSP